MPKIPSRPSLLKASPKIAQALQVICKGLSDLSLHKKVRLLNELRAIIHKVSPFANEPVDLVQWVPGKTVEANDYNPNTVAPPEMKLLALSILNDGYTQPIVTFPSENKKTREVVDGFHRKRVGSEDEEVCSRLHGYLPVVGIKPTQEGRSDRIASTIRHNRARGKHQVASMSDIVMELKKRNWSDKRIGKELGMDEDEILRLGQITTLAEAFADQKFTEAWEPTNDGDIADMSDPQDVEAGFDWCVTTLDEELFGWVDRTEKSSILYGEDPKVMGNVQKSKVANHWHWYAYTQPMASGVSKTRGGAKRQVKYQWGRKK